MFQPPIDVLHGHVSIQLNKSKGKISAQLPLATTPATFPDDGPLTFGSGMPSKSMHRAPRRHNLHTFKEKEVKFLREVFQQYKLEEIDRKTVLTQKITCLEFEEYFNVITLGENYTEEWFADQIILRLKKT